VNHTSLVQIRDNSISNAPASLSAIGSVASYNPGHNMILTEDVLRRYRANQGYIYLIHAVGTDRYKIGRSANPVARFETLKKQSPYPLQIIECFWTPDAVEDEKMLHGYLHQDRVYGEWFELKEELNLNGCKGYAAVAACSFVEIIKSLFERMPTEKFVNDIYRIFSEARTVEDVVGCNDFIADLICALETMPSTFPGYHSCIMSGFAVGFDAFWGYIAKKNNPSFRNTESNKGSK
jgi:hypothetical protein